MSKVVNLLHSKSEPVLKHWLIHCIQSIVTLGQEDYKLIPLLRSKIKNIAFGSGGPR